MDGGAVGAGGGGGGGPAAPVGVAPVGAAIPIAPPPPFAPHQFAPIGMMPGIAAAPAAGPGAAAILANKLDNVLSVLAQNALNHEELKKSVEASGSNTVRLAATQFGNLPTSSSDVIAAIQCIPTSEANKSDTYLDILSQINATAYGAIQQRIKLEGIDVPAISSLIASMKEFNIRFDRKDLEKKMFVIPSAQPSTPNRNGQNGRTQGSNQGGLICYNCNEAGHIRPDCPKLRGQGSAAKRSRSPRRRNRSQEKRR